MCVLNLYLNEGGHRCRVVCFLDLWGKVAVHAPPFLPPCVRVYCMLHLFSAPVCTVYCNLFTVVLLPSVHRGM